MIDGDLVIFCTCYCRGGTGRLYLMNGSCPRLAMAESFPDNPENQTEAWQAAVLEITNTLQENSSVASNQPHKPTGDR